MKRIALAFGTVAIGLSSALYAQVPAPQQGSNLTPAGTVGGGIVPPPPALVPLPPRANRSYSPGYSLYGGPEESRSQYPERHGTQSPRFSPLYKIPGVPDEITTEDQAREVRRNAAVEFGMFRNQFTGSTQFWMDHDRTRLAKVRYAMDEPMFRSIHPDYDWGDGGYMYNTAASVGGPQWPGSSNRVIVTPSEGVPTVRHNLNTASIGTPPQAPPTVRHLNNVPVAPARTVNPSTPLVASDRGE
jgi:hypothetical protein